MCWLLGWLRGWRPACEAMVVSACVLLVRHALLFCCCARSRTPAQLCVSSISLIDMEDEAEELSVEVSL